MTVNHELSIKRTYPRGGTEESYHRIEFAAYPGLTREQERDQMLRNELRRYLPIEWEGIHSGKTKIFLSMWL